MATLSKQLRYMVVALFALIFVSACGSDNDDVADVDINVFTATTTFEVTLSGAQQVPFNTSTQTATAFIQINENDNLIAASMDVSGITGFQAAHLHQGGIGVNGGVNFPLLMSNGMLELQPSAVSQAAIDSILAGEWYVNLHTTNFPDGEIRAQIVPGSVVIISFGLSGEQEVPSVATLASGAAYASYDLDTTALKVRVNTENAEDATMAHIHTGRIGENGPVLVGLEASTDAGAWQSPEGLTLDANTFAVLAGGGHYINVHTPANPSGEIRGQILTPNYVLATFPLQGSQEVPAVNTTASGDGYALINTDDLSVELKVLTQGVADASMAHIHTGRIGNNGPVLVGLVQSGSDVNMWMSPDDLTIDADTFAVLASGGHYVNVHTPANPGGELRGQILTDNYILATFPLQGTQEVPSLSTTASGEAYALVNTSDGSIELQVLTRGVMDATMAHIHTGRVGMNGPVLVGLEQSMDDPNRWMSPADLTVDADTLGVLASAGHYVNVHTPANPGGELRGQIVTDNFVLATFNISGAQEVPAVTTMADGDGYALVDTLGFGLELRVVTTGVDDATMAHIHTGRIGTNGAVLVGLEQDADNAGMWSTPADLTIDADILAVLASGGHYVNVHTPANPSGEIRGQILTDNNVLIAFPLSGSQEVPAVTTDASGSGYAIVNTTNFAVELIAVTQGVEDATMAHIHTGPAGSNGPVLVGLEQDVADVNIWKSPAALTIDATIFGVLAGGGHYVNVHTPANPSGEIRGQIQ